MQPRTKRQKQVLDFITRYIDRHGYEPSYQQIAWHLGVSSKAGVARHIKSLESQGLITRRREVGSFNLVLPASNSIAEAVCRIDWLDVPQPQNSFVEDWERETLFVPKFMLGAHDEEETRERLRAFRVPSAAMVEQHICEGDVVLIEKRSFARDGDVVVAALLSENKRVVMKQFYREGARIELRPANTEFVSIRLSADKIDVLGVFRGLLRPFS
jgi:repressor LexA